MSSFASKSRAERLAYDYDASEIISAKKFNLIMGATVLYGLLVNVVICALVGDVFTFINPIVFLIGYFVVAFAGIMINRKSTNPVVSFVGYNMVVLPVGLVISSAVAAYGGIGSITVVLAFAYTLVITALMIAAGILFPDFFEKLTGILLPCLIGFIICGIISAFIHVYGIWYAYIGAVLFSLYIGYDFYRSQQYAKTVDNAIDCALDIYLDIANLFLRILEILNDSKSK